MAVGFAGEQLQLAVTLTRFAMPVVLFSGVSAVFLGLLQSEHRFLKLRPFSCLSILSTFFPAVSGRNLRHSGTGGRRCVGHGIAGGIATDRAEKSALPVPAPFHAAGSLCKKDTESGPAGPPYNGHQQSEYHCGPVHGFVVGSREPVRIKLCQ